MITLDNVTKQYGQKTAVSNINLHIPAGELFAFLGPNGAGKTTTIKMLVGLLFPTKGTISVDGYDIQRDGDKARQSMSYVPDQPFLYEKLTGREFLQFIADMYGLTREYSQKRIETVIGLFNLHEFVDDLTERYSHGMRQRTVFASALVHEPRVLIVDEPTVGLDPRSVRELKDLLRRQAEQGTTVFLSSHSLDVVQELADRIAIIEHGKLIGCGTLESLRGRAAVNGSLEEVFLTLTREAEEEANRPRETEIPRSPSSDGITTSLPASTSSEKGFQGPASEKTSPLDKGFQGPPDPLDKGFQGPPDPLDMQQPGSES